MIIIPKRRNKKADKITNKHLTDMVDELLGGNHLVELHPRIRLFCFVWVRRVRQHQYRILDCVHSFNDLRV